MLQRACMDLMSPSTNEGKFCATVAMNLLKLYEVSYYYLAHAVIVPPCQCPPSLRAARAPLAPLFPSPMQVYMENLLYKPQCPTHETECVKALTFT